jgi:hypothetical protein
MPSQRIASIHANKLAKFGRIYTDTDGKKYIGVQGGRLRPYEATTNVQELINISTGAAGGGGSTSSSSSSSGGGESLAATLAIGNITDGHNLVISDLDFITTPGGNIQLDFGSDLYFALTTDAGAFGTPYIILDPVSLDLAWFNGGLTAIAASLFIQHTLQIQLATALLNISYLGGGGNRYLQTDNAGDISAVAIPAAYTDEQAQDAVGANVTKYLLYDDATPLFNFSTRSRTAVNSHNHFNFK